MDLSKKEDDQKPQVFINPEITWTSDETAKYEEGCLSIPEYYEEVERPAEVKVKYLDLDGKAHEITAKGLLATCLQHEIDHINGVLFIDHLSKLKRDRVIKKFAKAAKTTKEDRRRDWRSASCSWARRISPCPRSLEIVGAGHDVAAVYTRAPQPAGRGMALTAVAGRARGRTVRLADFHAEDR